MARYDVFLVSTLADREKAELIVRRLRALKFKVRYDKKREHTTPTPKDYRDADASQSVLVLWSKTACDTDQSDSDWVHAIAHHARSKDGVLLQAGLDKSTPDEPFNADKRYALSGMGPRKLVNGYFDLVDELGRRDGRKDLREWIEFKAGDKEAKEAWKTNHPTDPLSQVKKPAAKAKAATKPAAKATPTPKAAPKTSAQKTTASPAKPAPKNRVKPPPLVMKPPVPPVAEPPDLGRAMLGAVAVVVLGMLVMSAALSTKSGLPATAGAVVLDQCPAGQMPAYLLDEVPAPLEPGPIIDDTSEN